MSHVISSHDLQYKRKGLDFRIRRLASMVARYEKQFNRLKNFTREQWKSYIRDKRRCEQLNSVVQRHTRQVKRERSRLTELLISESTPTSNTKVASTSNQPPGPSGHGTSGPFSLSSTPSSAVLPPSNQTTTGYSPHVSTSAPNNSGLNQQAAINIQTLNTPPQNTLSFTSLTRLLSAVQQVETSSNSQSVGPSAIHTSTSILGSHQSKNGLAGVFNVSPSGSYQSIGSSGILRTGPAGFQSIRPAGIIHTGPSGHSQSIASPGKVSVEPSRSHVSVCPPELRCGCHRNSNSQSINQSQNIGLSTTAIAPNGASTTTTGHGKTLFVPFSSFTRGISVHRDLPSNITMTSSPIIDLTNLSDNSD